MTVVSNTSPLNYLVLLGKADILPALFGAVSIPPAVFAELSRAQAPDAVRAWIAAPPDWLHIQAPSVVDRSVNLDDGEREAIALAWELRADRILLDDAKARRAALRQGLRVAGTLAILFEASRRGLLVLGPVIEELRQTTFYVDENLVRVILSREDGRQE